MEIIVIYNPILALVFASFACFVVLSATSQAKSGAKGAFLPLRFNRLEDHVRRPNVVIGCIQEMVSEEESLSSPLDSLQFQRVHQIPAEIRHPAPGLDDVGLRFLGATPQRNRRGHQHPSRHSSHSACFHLASSLSSRRLASMTGG